MTTKKLQILEVANGYIVMHAEIASVFEKGNELDLIKHLCSIYAWVDVIDFDDQEKGETLADELNRREQQERDSLI